MAELIITDITDQLAGLNPGEDRVYAVEPGGWVVKVKTFLEPIVDHVTGKTHGAAARLTFSGSICGKDGKALRRAGSDAPIVWDHGHGHHVQGNGTDDPEAKIELLGRLECVRQTVHSERVHTYFYGYHEGAAGIPTRAAFEVRKAAEAGSVEKAAP